MFRLQQRLSYSFLLRTFFSQFLYPTLSWRSSCHSACSFSALPLAPLPLLTWPVLVCPRALAIVFLQVISSYPMGFISHLYAVYTPACITSRFPVPDRPKTELWLPPLPAPNLFLPSHQLTAAQSLWLLKSPHRSNPWFPCFALTTQQPHLVLQQVLSFNLWTYSESDHSSWSPPPPLPKPLASLAWTLSIDQFRWSFCCSPCATEPPEIV